jgi:16S rRNA (guanine527-N7)-methyltransferase
VRRVDEAETDRPLADRTGNDATRLRLAEVRAEGADARIAPGRREEIFGSALGKMERFASLLASEGVARGVIGPREIDRLWSRHLINCAAVAPLLPKSGLVIDLGSGAGLPGLVCAALRPDIEVELVEPKERRVLWLMRAISALGVKNAVVTRARAEELADRRRAQAVVARAVAPLGRLTVWSAPLLGDGGRLLAMKGRRAEDEVAASQRELHQCHLDAVEVLELRPAPEIEPTFVVSATRRARGRGAVVSRETRGGSRVGGGGYYR